MLRNLLFIINMYFPVLVSNVDTVGLVRNAPDSDQPHTTSVLHDRDPYNAEYITCTVNLLSTEVHTTLYPDLIRF